MKTLVTGAAGFIGFHLAEALLKRGDEVVGIDNLNDYYDPALKLARLKQLEARPGFRFQKIDIADKDATLALFERERFERVAHLAAQAGVRYSLVNPYVYVESNVNGFLNIIEGCRKAPISHLVFASSSSVYGTNKKMPFSTQDNVDHPVSLYAATKKANELMAHTYAHLYKIPSTGLRFFTVYGPWGRPDMAYFLFTRALFAGDPIRVFNYGKMKRDFTYIDDIVEGVVRVLDRAPAASPAPYRLYNIGNHKPESLDYFIALLEKYTGKKAIKKFEEMPSSDVPETYADVDDLVRDVGFKPSTSLEDGLKRFVEWYREYYRA